MLEKLNNQEQVSAAVERRSNEQVLVELDQTPAGATVVKLRYQSWAEGIGWITQKTISLSLNDAASLIGDLQAVVAQGRMLASQPARSKAVRREPRSEAGRNLIPFPQGRMAGYQRRGRQEFEEGAAKLIEFKPRYTGAS